MGIAARQAVVEDAAELTRLREVMITSLGPMLDTSWRRPCTEAFRAALADPDGPLQAFVTDAPDEPGVLAASSVGVIQRRLPALIRLRNPPSIVRRPLFAAAAPPRRCRNDVAAKVRE